MKMYTQEELQEILENHKHWLKQDCSGWEDMKVDLSYADLSGTNLRGADLSGANLNHADLRDVDLRESYLNDSDLRGAILKGADLRESCLNNANLSGADLSDTTLMRADLSGANLINANLSGAYLRGADLRKSYLINANLRDADLRDVDLSYVLRGDYAYLMCADLSGANLSGANLSGANLRGADLSGSYLSDTNLSYANLKNARNTPFIPQTCPDEGSFIGYKKVNGYIVKLEILADARRCSDTGRKCRCDKARVLDIQNINIDEPCILTEVANPCIGSFVYRVGEIVEEPEFDRDRWNECSEGIYFFINRQEAVDY